MVLGSGELLGNENSGTGKQRHSDAGLQREPVVLGAMGTLPPFEDSMVPCESQHKQAEGSQT